MDSSFPIIMGIFLIAIFVIVGGSILFSLLTTGLIFKGILDLIRSRHQAISSQKPPTAHPAATTCPNCGAQHEASQPLAAPARCPYCGTALP